MPNANDMPQGEGVLPELPPEDQQQEPTITVSKPWYFSRTILASIIGGVAGFAGLFGIVIDAGTVDNLVNISLTTATTISAGVAIYGRVMADSHITLR